MSHVHSITDFGAVGDGRANDTGAIRKAAATCAETGGEVLVPPGRYLAAGVRLCSHTTLRLAAGAVLVASTEEGDYAGCDAPALLWAKDAENVSVVGEGRIDGQGVSDERPAFRPKILYFESCRDLRVTDVTITHAPQWTIHLYHCDGAAIRGVTIRNNTRRLNTDGIDPDGSRNIVISDCRIVAGDDCIVIKARDDAPCENIAVTNCVLQTPCAALKIGTETVGDIRDVVFSNCVVRRTHHALTVYVKDGGTVESILFSNMSIETAAHRGHEWPILVSLERRTPESPLGRIRDIRFSDCVLRTRGRCFIEGQPERPVQDIVLDNITFRTQPGPDLSEVRIPRGAARVAPREPKPYDRANATLIAAHVDGLVLRGCRWRHEGQGAPEALRMEDVVGLEH